MNKYSRISHLERLATNEVAPSTDFRWYSLGLGELLAHALGEEDGGLWEVVLA